MNKQQKQKQSKARYNKNKDKILLQVKENYLKNRDKKLEYAKQYRETNKEIIKSKDYERYRRKAHGLATQEEIDKYKKDKYNKWINNRPEENRSTFHRRTTNYIRKNNLRPNVCSICGCKCKPQAHHPDYLKRNEVVFVCGGCHQNIHAGNIDCPKPIDILQLIKK